MLSIGPLNLESCLCLSPLAGYTALPFRLTVRELGGLGLATTDLVNARSLVERRVKALELVQTHPDDQPFAIQLFGSVPGEMRDAAVIAQSMGAASVDINMGCPVPKVCKVGGGSAMMTDLEKTAALARGMVEAVKIPVTAKMRLGWDDSNITAPDLARALEDAGIAAVFVHGRTRAQGFSGRVNLQGIRSVVQAVRRIPVIGNGDITTPQAAKHMLESTGCAGVSIGRGAFYNPWIFAHTCQYLATSELPAEPSFEERVRVMRRHLDRMIETFGEAHGCRIFRKIAPWYAKRFGPSNQFTKSVVLISSRADFDAALEKFVEWRRQFLDDQGQLLPKFRPAPLHCSFMDENGPDTAASGMAVPKGPVELW